MDFYDKLTDNGAFFFWIVVFLVIVLFILSIILLNKNKKLKKIIGENNSTIIPEKENIIVSPVNNDLEEKKVEVNIINKEIEENLLDIKENNQINIEKSKVEEEKKEIKDISKVEKSSPLAYQKNVLREMSKKMPTSPIQIEKSKYNDETSIYTVTNDTKDYDLDEVYLREDSTSPLENMEDYYEENDNMKFASEIVSRMEEEIKPSNIELTDYEKKQEEEAIISYDELLKVKDKIYNITEDEETDEFIDELKNFRLDLR